MDIIGYKCIQCDGFAVIRFGYVKDHDVYMFSESVFMNVFVTFTAERKCWLRKEAEIVLRMFFRGCFFTPFSLCFVFHFHIKTLHCFRLYTV